MAIYELPVKNLTPPFAPVTSISYMTDAFPLPSDVYRIYSMFLCYYVAWPCDLDLWPFDRVSCTVLLMSDPHTNYYYPMTIGYWVTSTEYLITFPLSETVTAHAPCHVTSNRGAKIVHIFEIPDPNLPLHLVTYTALRRRLSHVISKNSVFLLWRLQSLLRMRSITWPVHRRSPKTTRNNFLTPNCLFTIQPLCGYDDD